MCRNSSDFINLSGSEIQKRAEKHFWKMSGFSKENPPSVYQLEEIQQVSNTAEQNMQVKMLVKKEKQVQILEKGMWLCGKWVEYDIPLHLYAEQIQGLYVFLVTIEHMTKEEGSLLEQLYLQIWQNAYLDAAREWLKEWIGRKEQVFVSQCVAPGFYGIDLQEMHTLYEVMKGGKLGVKVLENGCLYPEKSFMGMYFLLENDLDILGKRCSVCLAQGKNCTYCMDKL